MSGPQTTEQQKQPQSGGALLRFYRPDEGSRVRNLMAACIGGLAYWGLYCQYHWLAGGWWSEALPGIGRALGDEFTIDPRSIIALVLTIAIAVGLYTLHNYKKWADFLIETEAEMKKVSWATKRQVVQESLVVVVTVVILGVYIFAVDMVITTTQKTFRAWNKKP